jgi:acyl-CoA reductase-like NAD-dependent aldehyde dehydrogenase
MRIMDRLAVHKTYKLFIGGKFPRTESGRSLKVEDGCGLVVAHVCHASRKDLREAVEAARAAQPKWAAATAYNRGQVIYRMAEMMEGKRAEIADAIGEMPKNQRVKKSKSRLAATRSGARDALREVDAAIDRLVCFAGWADKYAQVLGCNNPVAGPHYNFTVPEPTGVVGVVAPDEPAILGLITLLTPPLCAGNAIVAIASDLHPIAAAIFAEVCATSDLPGGVVNILTGRRAELIEHLANHRDVDAISAANLPRAQATTLRLGAAENVKRVHVRTLSEEEWHLPAAESPWTIEPFVEMKTIWHPSST